MKHDPYLKKSLILFTALSFIITIVDATFIIFFPHILQKLLVLNTFFIVFALFLMLSRLSNATLGNKNDRTPTFFWFLKIIAIELFSVLLFVNLLQTSQLFLHTDILPITIQYPSVNQTLHMHLAIWGLFPWSLIAIFAAGLGYIHYQHQESATISNLINNLRHTYYDTFIKRVANSTLGVVSNFVLIISICLGVLVLGKFVLTWLGITQLTQLRTGSLLFFLLVTLVSALKFNDIICDKIHKFSKNDGIAILCYCAVILGIFLACYVFSTAIVTFAKHYITIPDIQSLTLKHHLLIRWPLFFWGWWMCVTPIVASAIGRVSKGRSIRAVIIATLLLPAIILGLSVSKLDFDWATPIANTLFHATWLALIGPLLLSLILIKVKGSKLLVFGFMPKDEESLVTKTVKPILFLKGTLGVIPFFMAIFLIRNIFGIQFLVLLAAIPNMVFFMVVCLLFYKKLFLNRRFRANRLTA